MKYLNKIGPLFLALFVFTSCMFDDDVTDFGQGPLLVQFEKTQASQNFLQTSDNIIYDYEIPVVLFGGDGMPINSDITATIAVAPSSEAQEGVEFDFVGEPVVTIPAGELSANLTIKVYSENLDALNPPTLVLEIVESSETVSETNTTEVVLQAICPSDLAGDWVMTNGYTRDVTITELSDGLYRLSADNAFTGEYSIDFTDVCGILTIQSTYLEDNFGIPAYGSGEILDDGTLFLDYTVEGYFQNRPMYIERR